MIADKEQLAQQYDRDGFVFPIDIISSAEAALVVSDLESAERELADDAEKLSLLHAYPDRLLPSFDQITRHPAIIQAVSAILGPDLMVWSASLFDKPANSTSIVTWHQDLTYWGLDDAEEITAWIALTPATLASGCMSFVAGSHKHRQVAHIDTFDENNLLSRGQEIAVEVNADDGVAVELQPGQISLHHGHLFHSSGPNTTSQRRVASAIRYIKPSMKQQNGERLLVSQVAGVDHHRHFTVAGEPLGRLHPDDFTRCALDASRKRKILYQGAEDQAGKRY